MPANLPPAYHEVEARYRAARGAGEKLELLEEMLRLVPKHKGTEKLQGDLKARIAKLKRQPKKKGAARGFSHHVPKEGAGQVALVGPPNGGKSSLVGWLTHARPEAAAYPFTTREAMPGMMPFEDIAFQLVDLPPLSEEYVEPWVYDLARAADLIWVVVDTASSIDGLELTERQLAARKIRLYPADASAPEERMPGEAQRPALLVVTGWDKPGADENLRILRELVDRPWPVLAVSAVDGRGAEALKRATFEALEILRVYTKQPGKAPDRERPFTLRRGATVADLASQIHKDLAEQLKFARVWGAEVFDGQTVQKDFRLSEGDVVEIHV